MLFGWLTIKALMDFFGFLFQTRPQCMGRARMKCCVDVMGTKR